ncbi:hypothetical protein ACQPZJ_15620 [Actinoplanes sp. CA-054009]
MADASRESAAGSTGAALSAPDKLGVDVAADARLCEAALGEPLTAFVAGAESVVQYRAWRDGTDDERRRIASRLAAARRVILVFQIENDTRLAMAWLRDVGSAAEVPARMIRHKGDDESVGLHLAESAARWLARYRPAAALAV